MWSAGTEVGGGQVCGLEAGVLLGLGHNSVLQGLGHCGVLQHLGYEDILQGLGFL